jgi:pyridoxine kinase
MDSLQKAIQVMHEKYRIPHIVITSVKLEAPDHPPFHLSVVGSSMTSEGQARLFKIVFPAIDCYFSGTGDMFAALMVFRMREAVYTAVDANLKGSKSWLSSDEIDALDLPLARAAEKVLASMHEVLTETSYGMKDALDGVKKRLDPGTGEEEMKKRVHLAASRAAELRLVQNLDCLRSPTMTFQARRM